jgi:hypothetical protein
VRNLPVDMPRDGMLVDGELLVGKRLFPKAGPGPTLPTLLTTDASSSGNRPDPTLWSLSDVLGITAKAKKLGITLPTLIATDFKPYAGLGAIGKLMAKRSRPLRDVLPFIEGEKKINPVWAEWYMNWCPEWTDLSEKPNVGAWLEWTRAGRWWTDEVESSVLPRTLPLGNGVSDLNARIHTLGNGQVPLAAAAAFTLLKQAVDA